MNSQVNKRTGFPVSKHSSIKRLEQELERAKNNKYYRKSELLDFAKQSSNKNGANFAISQYRDQLFGLIAIEGELAYEKGDWDIAERKLLSIVPYEPNVAERLGIMYRKEKRFKDEISVLTLVIEKWNSSVFNVYHGSTSSFEERLSKTKNYLKKHGNVDSSKGISPNFLPYDKELIQELLRIRDKKPEK